MSTTRSDVPGAERSQIDSRCRASSSPRRSFEEVATGRRPEFPTIEWDIHTTVDPSMRDAEGRDDSAPFVQSVPHALAEGSWDDRRGQFPSATGPSEVSDAIARPIASPACR